MTPHFSLWISLYFIFAFILIATEKSILRYCELKQLFQTLNWCFTTFNFNCDIEVEKEALMSSSVPIMISLSKWRYLEYLKLKSIFQAPKVLIFSFHHDFRFKQSIYSIVSFNRNDFVSLQNKEETHRPKLVV